MAFGVPGNRIRELHMRTILFAAAALTASIAAPAQAATVVDAIGDFLPTYTAGPRLADLDVASFSVNYSNAGQFFTLGAVLAGDIDPTTAGIYVIGVNTGTGTIRPFASIGQGNVIFNQAIVLRKDGTGSIGATALDPNLINIAGNIITARIALSLLPSTGFAAEQYGFNLWPRIGTGNNNQITDFSPENATLAAGAVPEPATWATMLLGMAVAGSILRRRARRTTVRYA